MTENIIWLVCDKCGRGFDCDLDTARKIWDAEEKGVPVTCGNCDAVAREKDAKFRQARERR